MSQQVIKLVWKGLLLSAVETRTMFYYGCDTGTPSVDDATELNSWTRAALGDVLPFLVDDFHWYECEAFYQITGGHWMTFYTHAETLAGTVATDISAYQIAALVGARTATLKARGRKFLPGVAEASTLDGEVNSSFRSALITFAANYIRSVNVPATGRTWFPGVVSKNSAFAPFNSSTVGSFLSTMRRRKPGYGI